MEDDFAGLAEYAYRRGVGGLYVCGVTGDAYKMRVDERKRATEIAVEASRPFDGTVIVHVGAIGTRDALELAEHAASAGASAVASMPPANHPQHEVVGYYRDVAKAAGLPTLVYHIPQLTQFNPSVSALCDLLDTPGVAGIKFSNSDFFLMRRVLLARPDIVVFTGCDELLTLGMLYGACGGIGMHYCLFPGFFAALYASVKAGDIPRALQMQDSLCVYLDAAANWIGMRPVFDHALRERGLVTFTYRRPRTVLDDSQKETFNEKIVPLIEAIDRWATADGEQ